MEAFKNHFFVTDHPEVNPFQADDPDPLPPHDLAPITQGEITSALSTISNKLASGLSAHNSAMYGLCICKSPCAILPMHL